MAFTRPSECDRDSLQRRKGRTGMVVASLLLRQCIQQCPDSALDFFASKRTSRDIINGGKVKPQRVSSGR